KNESLRLKDGYWFPALLVSNNRILMTNNIAHLPTVGNQAFWYNPSNELITAIPAINERISEDDTSMLSYDNNIYFFLTNNKKCFRYHVLDALCHPIQHMHNIGRMAFASIACNNQLFVFGG